MMAIPCEFPEQTSVLRPAPGTEKEVLPLPVFRDGQQVISCWRLSWRERFSALFYGRAWVGVLGGVTQPPVWITTKRGVFSKVEQTDG